MPTMKDRELAIERLLVIVRAAAAEAGHKSPMTNGQETESVVLSMGLSSLVDLGVSRGELFLASLKVVAESAMDDFSADL